VTYTLCPLLRRESPGFARQVDELYLLFRAAHPAWLPRALLPLIILAEELVWRGVVIEALGRRFSPAATVLLGAAVYAAAHLPAGSPLLGALALACGLYWSALRVGTGSLWSGLIAHLIWDACVFVLRPLA
jgi:uncharacterized protein